MGNGKAAVVILVLAQAAALAVAVLMAAHIDGNARKSAVAVIERRRSISIAFGAIHHISECFAGLERANLLRNLRH